MRFARIKTWLLALADPEGVPPPVPKPPLDLREFQRMLQLAQQHGVLPSVLANIAQVVAQFGKGRLVARGDGAKADLTFNEAVSGAAQNVRRQTAIVLMLRRQLKRVSAALAERAMPAVVLKGPDFADRLYPDPGLKPFRDIDLLVPPRALGDVEQVLEHLGYRPAEPAPMKHAGGYGQRSWRPSDGPGGNLEIHHNLVNSPTLRRRVSVEFDDLEIDENSAAAAELPKPSPSALLLIAAVHGATSHGFDRLQILCDVCQSVRGAAGHIDNQWLAKKAKQTGSSFAVATALALAGRALGEPACFSLLQELRRALPIRIWPGLLTPSVVLRSHSPVGAFRREIFRELLKRK